MLMKMIQSSEMIYLEPCNSTEDFEVSAFSVGRHSEATGNNVCAGFINKVYVECF